MRFYKCKMEDGEDYERQIEAIAPQFAAEAFIRMMEWNHAEFPIAAGKQAAIVTVDGVRYEVKGITEPQYEAKKL